MYEAYFQHFKKTIQLSEAEEERIKGYLSVKRLRKRQYLLQDGDVCRHIAFIERGVLRLYRTEEDGTEHIVDFAVEGMFASDLYSFLTGQPSSYNIDAIEDSELVLISKAGRDELIEICPKYQRYMLQVLAEAYIRLQGRMDSVISMALPERYKYLLESCPEVMQRVPQHMIASYMGLTPATLSRLRAKLSTNK